MLVVTMAPGDAFKIGEDIRIHLIRIKGKQARIGVEAAKTIPVNREKMKKDKPK